MIPSNPSPDTGAGTPLTAEDFWRGKCLACAHPEHEMTCPQPVRGGNPSDGPTYCPCADRINWMEREIIRLRSRPATDRAQLSPEALGDAMFEDALASYRKEATRARYRADRQTREGWHRAAARILAVALPVHREERTDD